MTMPKLSGYDINEVLFEGAKSQVYRGIRHSDQLKVVIKLFKHPKPTHNELLAFRHQYHLLKDLSLEGVVIPLALITWQSRLALIMPDNASIDLHQYQAGQALELKLFLSIALQLAEILERLHQQGITHKDIKASNIIIQPETLEVALIDFSIATQLNSESQSLSSPETLSGTLTHMSPEQTGRMNRGIDYRTDFYSLGITFYELLSGQLPFIYHDPLALVHSHLAREATPLVTLRPDIPQVISAIINKLMAKSAEDRYQSGFGLKADLQRCQQALQTLSVMTDFPVFTLGQGDIAQRFSIPEKLYGRFAEVKTLLTSFERVCKGGKEAVIIRGLSGIGKTALVNEVHKPMTCSRGYFIQGKFDQFKRDTPFFAMA